MSFSLRDSSNVPNMLGIPFFSIAADLILIVHFAFVLFVVLGLGVIWIGGWREWAFVKNRGFRFAHLGAMGVVVLESGLGVTCPLTTWESGLRGMAGQQGYGESFMEHWIHRLMFIELPPAVFTASICEAF